MHVMNWTFSLRVVNEVLTVKGKQVIRLGYGSNFDNMLLVGDQIPQHQFHYYQLHPECNDSAIRAMLDLSAHVCASSLSGSYSPKLRDVYRILVGEHGITLDALVRDQLQQRFNMVAEALKFHENTFMDYFGTACMFHGNGVVRDDLLRFGNAFLEWHAAWPSFSENHISSMSVLTVSDMKDYVESLGG
jgi:hypothetical protein